MFDYLIMFFILAFLGFELLFKARLLPVNHNFFDADNSKAMRGFWCIVIIIVHVPDYLQNSISDMIGSFAFIGVSFFFMTSAYGLTISQDRNPDGIRFFWRKRLPRLLIISWIINILSSIAYLIVYETPVTISEILRLNPWVEWLLICYLAFWLSNIIFKKELAWKTATIVMSTIFSVIMYFLGRAEIVKTTNWCPEVFGFIWGILLATFRTRFVDFFSRKWWLTWTLSAVASLILGVAYLKFKTIPVAGDYVLKIILGAAIILFTLIANAKVELGNRVSLFIGAISFEVYLVHLVVIDVLEARFDDLPSGIFVLACIVVTLIVSVIIHAIADKPVKKISSLLGVHRS